MTKQKTNVLLGLRCKYFHHLRYMLSTLSEP